LSPGKSAAWCSLDAAVLQVIVFQKLLKLSPEKIACQENIAYTRDEAAALKNTKSGCTAYIFIESHKDISDHRCCLCR